MTQAATLTIDGLGMRFGGLVAVEGISFQVKSGEITSIIGPNGAGKTTLFNCITGFYRPTAGRVLLEAPDRRVEVTRLRRHAVARRAGIARTFQNIRLFKGMSVLENLAVAWHDVLAGSLGHQLAGMFNTPGHVRREAEVIDACMGWLDRFGLAARADDLAGSLPYGLQRKLEIARAMCLRPRFICLDEPAAGLNSDESIELAAELMRLRQETGVGVLLIEHDMGVVMQASDNIVVMEHGRHIASGRPDEIRDNPAVISAYLGEEHSRGGAAISRLRKAGTSPDLLRIEGLRVGYGAGDVLHGVDLTVREGQIVALLGANGAGKSTLLNALFASPLPHGGRVSFAGRQITGLPPHEGAGLGIAHVPEGRHIMPDMTVFENLQLGAILAQPESFDRDLDAVYALFPRLHERATQRAGTMSGGEQQMLAIGRALMQRPRLLLLDEPSLGLAPLITDQIFQAISRINAETGMAIIVVEQSVQHALATADHAYVLRGGRIALSGPAEQLAHSAELRNAYLTGHAA